MRLSLEPKCPSVPGIIGTDQVVYPTFARLVHVEGVNQLTLSPRILVDRDRGWVGIVGGLDRSNP